MDKQSKVEVPTYVVGVLEFACGAIGTIITSFDTWASKFPRIEIYGTKGSLSVPDKGIWCACLRAASGCGRMERNSSDTPLP